MPKITAHGGPTNARADETSPVVPASEPLIGAEAGQGHSNSSEVLVDESGPELAAESTEPTLDEVQDETVEEEASEGDSEEAVDYDAMSLAELKAVAEDKGVATYGTKAQIAQRLREADEED